MLLLHSLSGNTRLFTGLLTASLAEGRTILIPDMRGRGRTPVGGGSISLDEAVADIDALLRHFGLKKIVLAGHSYGGLTALHYSAQRPSRVEKLILLDAAAQMHPAAPWMAALTAMRLDHVYASKEVYRTCARAAPFVDAYHPAMAAFFDEDMADFALGACLSRARSMTVAAAIHHITAHGEAGWLADARAVRAPTLLVHARRPYFMGLPMLTEADMDATLRLMPDARSARAAGNHFSMLYGEGAVDVRRAVDSFLAS